jgi:di- and tripeptidase
MVNSLAKFVGFKTISSRPEFAGECHQGAAFLRRHCNYLGAQTKLLVTGQDMNPILFAKFPAVSGGPVEKTILFYGHYDVVGAESTRPKWRTDPFHLSSINGYLYGRGVSDNKGPTLAALYAAAELTKTKQLGCNVVFLIEGEEESGSRGFSQAVQENKDLIGRVDWILLANSYWLDDHIPCLTYGLRGVVHANLIVSSRHPDLHSGIDGSSLLDEPMKDLTILLGTLVGPKGKINLPGFHDPVLPLSDVERERYDAITEALLPRHPEIEDAESFTASLMHRWREPSLTIHSIAAPGCKSSSTTISRKAKATLSIRLVPNQDVNKVADDLIEFCKDRFAQLESQNTLTVEITGKAEPWLGDPDNELFNTLSQAVTAVWSADTGSKRYNHPIPNNDVRPGTTSEESSDSITSHIERIMLSSSPDNSRTPAAPRGHAAIQPTSAPARPSVPTSSTLAHNIESAHTPADSGTQSPVIGTPLPTSVPTTIKPKPISHHPYTHSSSRSLHSSSSQSKPQAPPPRFHKPLYIREGGSIPTIRFLEKAFDAPAAHLPCGQASDNAHLDNERLRVENLYKSREIFRAIFGDLGRKGLQEMAGRDEGGSDEEEKEDESEDDEGREE